MRGTTLLILSIVLAGCGGSSKSSGGSPDGGTQLASSDKQQCELYLTCLNLVDQGAYAGALALYGDSSACWQNGTTSANCASACVTAYDQIEGDCTCSSPTSCELCSVGHLPEIGSAQYTVTSNSDSCATVTDFSLGGASDGSVFVDFELEVSTMELGDSGGDVNASVPMTCGGASTFAVGPMLVSGSCPETQTVAETLQLDDSGVVTLGLTIHETCNGMSADCTDTVVLAPPSN